MGNKIPLQSDIKGVDIVTGQPATTGGPYASPNPVKPFDHPLAVEAQRRNKTGPFAVAKAGVDEATVNVNPAETEEEKLKKYMDAEKAKEDKVKTVPTSTATTTTPGTKAATTAPVGTPTVVPPKNPSTVIPMAQPQGMNKPTSSSQTINTSTVQPPPAVSPADKVAAANAQGDTSKTTAPSSQDAKDQSSKGA